MRYVAPYLGYLLFRRTIGWLYACPKRLPARLAALLLLVGSNTAGAQTLRIYHIDVEQGDATLFITPSGKSLLVDSGKNGHGKRVKAAMDTAGVSQIGAFVATHYHEDHYGGIDDLVKTGIPVLASFDRGDKECCLPAAKRKEVTFRGYQQAVGQTAIHLQRGMRIELDPLVTVTCISSGGVVLGEDPPVPATRRTDMSVSLLVTFGAFRYFVGGDIEAATETKIAARDLVTAVDVYQANHHGSHSSSSGEFMGDLSPAVVVVSNGSMEIPTSARHHPQDLRRDPGPARSVPDEQVLPSRTLRERSRPVHRRPKAEQHRGHHPHYGGRPFKHLHGRLRHAVPAVQYQALPPVLPLRTVVIDSLLPDPVGNDEQLEEVTLKNEGTQPVSLTGWKLRDRSGFEWTLSDTIAPNAVRTFVRKGQRMSLNNNGDDIMLLDDAQVERDRFTYTSSVEGVVRRRP